MGVCTSHNTVEERTGRRNLEKCQIVTGRRKENKPREASTVRKTHRKIDQRKILKRERTLLGKELAPRRNIREHCGGKKLRSKKSTISIELPSKSGLDNNRSPVLKRCLKSKKRSLKSKRKMGKCLPESKRKLKKLKVLRIPTSHTSVRRVSSRNVRKSDYTRKLNLLVGVSNENRSKKNNETGSVANFTNVKQSSKVQNAEIGRRELVSVTVNETVRNLGLYYRKYKKPRSSPSPKIVEHESIKLKKEQDAILVSFSGKEEDRRSEKEDSHNLESFIMKEETEPKNPVKEESQSSFVSWDETVVRQRSQKKELPTEFDENVEFVHCRYCRRTFFPHRIQKHESVCIEKKEIVQPTVQRSIETPVVHTKDFKGKRGWGIKQQKSVGASTALPHPPLFTGRSRTSSSITRSPLPKISNMYKGKKTRKNDVISTISNSDSKEIQFRQRRGQWSSKGTVKSFNEEWEVEGNDQVAQEEYYEEKKQRKMKEWRIKMESLEAEWMRLKEEKKREEEEIRKMREVPKLLIEDILSSESEEEEEGETYECQICYDDFTEDEGIRLEKCGHLLHCECLREDMIVRVNDGLEIRCPIKDCHSESSRISQHEVRELLRDHGKNYDQYLNNSLNEFIRKDRDTMRCFHPECDHAFSLAPATLRFTCIGCKRRFCAQCKVEYHFGQSCQEYQRREEKDSVVRWLKENGGKQCPNCDFWMEKDGGCRHMRCPQCKTDFCWVCRGPFPLCPCREKRIQRENQEPRNRRRDVTTSQFQFGGEQNQDMNHQAIQNSVRDSYWREGRPTIYSRRPSTTHTRKSRSRTASRRGVARSRERRRNNKRSIFDGNGVRNREALDFWVEMQRLADETSLSNGN